MEKPPGIGIPPESSKLDNTEKLLKEVKVWKKEQEAQKKEPPEEKGKAEETEKNKVEKQKEGKPKKKKKEKPASKEIVAHFQEELKKLEDFPDQKEYQKIKKCDRALELIEDWLPFGYLDNFQGVTKILSIMEAAKPKTALTFGKIQKDVARKIAYEMAFQYSMGKKKDTKKIEIIRNFINEWLKDKKLTYISEHSEIDYHFVWRVFKGRANNAQYRQVKKLSDYIEAQIKSDQNE